MLPHVLMGEGYLARTPHPFESAGRPLCPLPQGERAREVTTARLASPHASRRIAARFRWWKDLGSRGAAMLLGMRAGESNLRV